MKRGRSGHIFAICLLIFGELAISSQPATAAPVVANFSFTGAAQSWTVPSGVTAIQFQVVGASGGTSWGVRGGYGESVTGTLSVTPGEILSIYVGQQGSPHSTVSNPAVFNGGGAGYYYAAGGGGGSDIRQGGSTLNNRVIVAGGGGGASHSFAGGDAGFTSGVKGADAQGSAGLIGIGGSGGTQSAGGAGGAGASMCGNAAGTSGSLGVGGTGGQASSGGGGGGGGYYGGGGGGSGCNASSGGGGSSYINSSVVSSYSYALATNTGNGSIRISYSVITLATVSVALVGGGNQVTFGTAATLRVSVSSAGKVTVLAAGKRIPGCISKSTAATYDCAWKPSRRGSVLIQVRYINTSGTEINNDSPQTLFLVTNRISKR